MIDRENKEKRPGLAKEAYEEIPGDRYQPYIPASAHVPELTFKALTLGVLLGILFGAANAYLGLRVGLTVSASIPAAVMSIAFFRLIRRGTILETNIVQTVGSAGESLAAGVIFTVPALLLWGMEVKQLEVFTLAALGGLLGVFFMIPLRRFLISREHGKLPYPEGTACAEVQVAGEAGGSKARLVFWGLGLGALYKFLSDRHGISLWNESPRVDFPGKISVGADATPELLGVGYIIGWRLALVMFSGGALAWLVIIPLINLLGGNSVIYPGLGPISAMDSDEIWSRYIRYIGAGGVAYGGGVTLVKSLPTIVESIRIGFGKFGEEVKRRGQATLRTDRDIPLQVVGLSIVVIAVLLDVIPVVPVNFVSAVLMVIFTFFFVTVSSRVVGLIGASSNPVSGMTIAALLGTSLIFVALGLDEGPAARAQVLAVGAVVCIAAAIAGDTSQDLKTGFLLGATPWKQQVGEIVGVLTSATVMGAILMLLHKSYGVGSDALPAPQATLMSLVIDGVLNANLPWAFVLGGMAIAAFVEHVLKQSALAFAVGLYLPLSLTTPVLVGGAIRRLIESRYTGDTRNEKREQGVLFSSGLIAGAAMTGVMIAAAIFFSERMDWLKWLVAHWQIPYHASALLGTLLGAVVFAALSWTLYRVAKRTSRED